MAALDLTQAVSGAVLEARDDGVIDRVTEDGALFRSQDVTDILELNQRDRMEADKFKGFRLAPTFRHVARIPVAAIDIAAAQGYDILNDSDDLRRFLNDPQNKAFRVSTERV